MIEELFCIGYSGIFYIQNFLETPSNIGNIKISRVIDERLIKSEILTILYGPVLYKNYLALLTHPKQLAKTNGLWKSILALSDLLQRL